MIELRTVQAPSTNVRRARPDAVPTDPSDAENVASMVPVMTPSVAEIVPSVMVAVAPESETVPVIVAVQLSASV